MLLKKSEKSTEYVSGITALERLDHGVVEVVNDNLSFGLLTKARQEHTLAELFLEFINSILLEVAHDLLLELASLYHDGSDALSESELYIISLEGVIQYKSECVYKVVRCMDKACLVLLSTPDYLVKSYKTVESLSVLQILNCLSNLIHLLSGGSRHLVLLFFGRRRDLGYSLAQVVVIHHHDIFLSGELSIIFVCVEALFSEVLVFFLLLEIDFTLALLQRLLSLTGLSETTTTLNDSTNGFRLRRRSELLYSCAL